MTKWTALLLLLCLALLGQDRGIVKEREAEYKLVPFGSHGPKERLRIVGGRPIEQHGNIEVRPKALIQTSTITVLADEMEWNHDTDEIKLRGNVVVELGR